MKEVSDVMLLVDTYEDELLSLSPAACFVGLGLVPVVLRTSDPESFVGIGPHHQLGPAAEMEYVAID